MEHCLCTTIYRKPGDRRNLLHYSSAHQKALKDNIPYSLALRIKRICSETSEVAKHLNYQICVHQRALST